MVKILRILFACLALICLPAVIRGQEGIIIPFDQIEQLFPLPGADFPLLPAFGGLLFEAPDIAPFGSLPLITPQRTAPVDRIPMRQRIIPQRFRNPRVPVPRQVNNIPRMAPITRLTPQQLHNLNQIRIDLNMLPNFADPLGYHVGNRMIDQLESFIQATSRSSPTQGLNQRLFPTVQNRNQVFQNERLSANFPNFNRFLGGMANNNILQFNPLHSNRGQDFQMDLMPGRLPVRSTSQQQLQMSVANSRQGLDLPNVNQFQLPIENINQETARNHPLLMLPNQRSLPEQTIIPTPPSGVLNLSSLSNDGLLELPNSVNEQPNPSNIDIAKQMSGLLSINNEAVITTPTPQRQENTQQNIVNEQTPFRMDEVIEIYHPNRERSLCFSGRNIPKDFLNRVMEVITFAIQGPRSETICSAGPLSLPELQQIEELMMQEKGHASPTEILLANYKNIPSTSDQSRVQALFTVDSNTAIDPSNGQPEQGSLARMV